MRGFYGPPALVGLGGLVLMLAAAAGWVTEDTGRTVGGITVEGSNTIAGAQFAAVAIPLGLAAIVLAGLLAVLRGAARRIVGLLAAVAGLAGAAVVVAGLLDATGEGTITAAPWAALAGAVAVTAGGVLAAAQPAGGPRRGRYEVPTEQATDDEWEIASGDQE